MLYTAAMFNDTQISDSNKVWWPATGLQSDLDSCHRLTQACDTRRTHSHTHTAALTWGSVHRLSLHVSPPSVENKKILKWKEIKKRPKETNSACSIVKFMVMKHCNIPLFQNQCLQSPHAQTCSWVQWSFHWEDLRSGTAGAQG